MPHFVTRKDGSQFRTHRFTRSQVSGRDQYTYKQRHDIVHCPYETAPFNPYEHFNVRTVKINDQPYEEYWTQEVL